MNCDIKAVWEAYNTSLMNFIRSKVSNEYDAEDLLQEVFLKLNRNIGRIKDEAKLKPYIYQIAKNAIIDYYRAVKDIVAENEELDILGELEVERANLNNEVAVCLRKMIITLPEKYQVPAELYDIKGMKHKDIAEQLKISVSGSKTRVQRARQKLKESLLNCCDFEFDSLGNIIDYKQKKECGCENEKYKC